MRDVRLDIPIPIRKFLSRTIREARGNEVFFLGKLAWSREGRTWIALLEDVDALARGNRHSVPAILSRASGWDIALHNHPSGNLEPSDPDIEVAGLLAREGLSFAIISNDASDLYLVTRLVPPDEPVPLDLDEIRGIFSSDGLLARGLDGFESRPGQVELAVEVARALNEERIIASEAGTGIGKSFAYLIPSILWAVANRRRIVVSTGTIQLQEQLVSKDLPFLERVLPVEFTYALVKGRGNYACKRKVEELAGALESPDIVEEGEREQLRELVAWARSSADGSRSDLGYVPPQAVWEKVMSETDKSLKAKCPHHDTCFFYSARRRMSAAQVLVVNHHLFFADLAVRVATESYEFAGVLPPYERVIFDEAQHIEDVASEHMGHTFGRAGLLMRLHRFHSKDGKHGTVPHIVKRLTSQNDPVAADSIRRTFSDAWSDIVLRVEDAFDAIEARVLEAAQGRGAPSREGGPGETIQLRQRPGKDARFWKALASDLRAVQEELERIRPLLERGLFTIDGAAIPLGLKDSLRLELTSFEGRLEGLLVDLGSFCNYADESRVRWLTREETRRGGTDIGLSVAPVRVSEELRDHLFERVKTGVLTSATLSVAGNTRYIEERLGLSKMEERFSFHEHPSPFDYVRQTALLVPTDLALPGDPRFEGELIEAVYRLLEATEGRAFVLFTSYSLLRRVHGALKERLVGIGLRPTAQGDAPRSDLIDRFKTGAHDVLFGTDSFWEGVDVRGRALESVIITKLPFRVPTEPLQEARMEEIEARGGNSFAELAIPQAVLKFKQGFGRLIRSTTDRGIVAVLDRRILTKAYGRVFLQSLPETSFTAGPLGDLVERARRFLERSGAPAEEPRARPAAVLPAEPGRLAGPGSPPWAVDASKPESPTARTPFDRRRPPRRRPPRPRAMPEEEAQEAGPAGPPPPW